VSGSIARRHIDFRRETSYVERPARDARLRMSGDIEDQLEAVPRRIRAGPVVADPPVWPAAKRRSRVITVRAPGGFGRTRTRRSPVGRAG